MLPCSLACGRVGSWRRLPCNNVLNKGTVGPPVVALVFWLWACSQNPWWRGRQKTQASRRIAGTKGNGDVFGDDFSFPWPVVSRGAHQKNGRAWEFIQLKSALSPCCFHAANAPQLKIFWWRIFGWTPKRSPALAACFQAKERQIWKNATYLLCM